MWEREFLEEGDEGKVWIRSYDWYSLNLRGPYDSGIWKGINQGKGM